MLLLPLLVAALCLSGPAVTPCAAAKNNKKSYQAVFSFGDSLSDAGNLIVDGIPKSLTTARKPYGMTFFGRPTGRCSNGRVVVDFLGNIPLPPVNPPLYLRPWLPSAANFAVLFLLLVPSTVYYICWTLQYPTEMSLFF